MPAAFVYTSATIDALNKINEGGYFLLLGKTTPWPAESTPPNLTDPIPAPDLREKRVSDPIRFYRMTGDDNVLLVKPTEEVAYTGLIQNQIVTSKTDQFNQIVFVGDNLYLNNPNTSDLVNFAEDLSESFGTINLSSSIPNGLRFIVDDIYDYLYAVQDTTITKLGSNGNSISTGQTPEINSRQRFEITNAVGGTFRIRYNSALSVPIDYNAEPNVIQAAIENIVPAGAGNIAVDYETPLTAQQILDGDTGINSNPMIIEFVNALGSSNQPLLQAVTSGLAGISGTITAVFTEIQRGISRTVLSIGANLDDLTILSQDRVLLFIDKDTFVLDAQVDLLDVGVTYNGVPNLHFYDTNQYLNVLTDTDFLYILDPANNYNVLNEIDIRAELDVLDTTNILSIRTNASFMYVMTEQNIYRFDLVSSIVGFTPFQYGNRTFIGVPLTPPDYTEAFAQNARHVRWIVSTDEQAVEEYRITALVADVVLKDPAAAPKNIYEPDEVESYNLIFLDHHPPQTVLNDVIKSLRLVKEY